MRTVLNNAGRPFGKGRTTAQRRTIADAVPHRAFTVAELAECVAECDPAIGLATVYRAVGAMEAAGWLARVGESAGNALYVRCEEDGHHHHAVCTGCGRVEHTPCPVAGPGPAQSPAGFRVTSHELTLYGLCAECDASSPGRRAERG